MLKAVYADGGMKKSALFEYHKGFKRGREDGKMIEGLHVRNFIDRKYGKCYDKQ